VCVYFVKGRRWQIIPTAESEIYSREKFKAKPNNLAVLAMPCNCLRSLDLSLSSAEEGSVELRCIVCMDVDLRAWEVGRWKAVDLRFIWMEVAGGKLYCNFKHLLKGRVAEWLVRSLSEWQVTGTNPAFGKHVTDLGQYAVHLSLPNRH
jgi:hypothetical protein